VASLAAQVEQLRDQAIENRRLRDMLGFEQSLPFDLIPVRVVAREPSSNFKSAVVNAGANRGVLPFMPVITERGVAGKIVQVGPFLSIVQLIRDPLNRTSIMVRRSRAVSILETENGTDFSGRFRTHEPVATGDTVITSGLGGIYPHGLRIGVVDRILDENDPLFKKAVITPSCDISHLEELFIVRLPPQWAAFKAQLDSLFGQK
jgi:rod shape-determining protein MreC